MANEMLEGAFYSYMYEDQQASRDWNRHVLEFYVQHFEQGQRVLDVGCGEGQFLEIATAQGISALGVDSDTRMVSISRQKGLDVVEDDLFNYLAGHKEQFDGVFSSNLIEHLTVQDALRFLQSAFQVLRPGGTLLVATPNPESLIVHLYEFWRDMTHVRLYSRPLLEFLLSWAGFRDIESGGNPRTVWEPSAEVQAVPGLLKSLTSCEKSIQLDSVIDPQIPKQERSSWRRLVLAVRRRVARFLVQTVMFEEFSAIEAALGKVGSEFSGLATHFGTLSATTQQVGHALYQSHAKPLTAPREVFAKGVKPVTGQD
jgi:SAM-dependent methyltransferase